MSITPTYAAHNAVRGVHPARPIVQRTAHPAVPAPRRDHGVHEYARRMAFLTELDSQTWLNRYSASEWLADPQAVTSIAAYGRWLRRLAGAWTRAGMASSAQLGAAWTFSSIGARAVDLAELIDLDLRDLARSAGGLHGGTRIAPSATSQTDSTHAAASLYVVLSVAQEIAALAADVAHLSGNASPIELPQRLMAHCSQLAEHRAELRRDLADWGDLVTSAQRERAIVLARQLTEELSAGLVQATGW